MPRPVRIVLILLPVLVAVAAGVWFLRDQNREPQPQQANEEAPRPQPVDPKPGDPKPGDPKRDPEGPRPGPKLVVLVVFDQMRGDYLDRWATAFGPDGFERMKRDGVWYSACHLPYACSSTGPGHASIATGAPPSKHGIIENEWFERHAGNRPGEPIYCAQPTRPYALVPPLPADAGRPGRGDESGFSPERLLVPTVGDALLEATGGTSRVFTLSIKDRTAVLMGGQKPTGAYCFDTRDGKFHTGAYYRDRVHPWVEAFNASGTVNRWVGKEWDRLRPELDYDRLAGPDLAAGEGFGAGQRRIFPHSMSEAKEPGQAYYTALEISPFGNEILFELTKQAITAEKLGSGTGADLLCVSCSSNDLIGHQWGPNSHEVLDVTLRSDRMIAAFLKFLDETVGRERYVMIITADHGVCPIPEQERTREKYPAARRMKVVDVLGGLERALNDTFGPGADGPVPWLDLNAWPDRYWPWVYLNRRAIKAAGKPFSAVSDFAAQWLGNQPGMQVAFTREQIERAPAMGGPPEASPLLKQVRLAYHPDRCGDVIVIPRPGVQVSAYASGTGHGTPHAYDTHVPVLVYGAGVPALGRRNERVSSLIVAPLLARALGIRPPAGAMEPVPAEIAAKRRMPHQ